MRRWGPWVIVWGATLTLTAFSTVQSLGRYWEFRTGWGWDLAFYNQWLWSFWYGDQTISVRPLNTWGSEGPSIWARTHLDPIRLLVVPFYGLWPRPEILIVANNLMLWWALPAAFGLARFEGRSDAVALSGVAFVPLTPLLWPLLWNDYREVTVATPFILWTIHGFRARRKWLAIGGAAGMLACREEFGVMLATFAILPAKDREDLGTTYAWARAAAYVGVSWLLFAFFGSQSIFIARSAPVIYIDHFGGPKPPVLDTLRAVADFLFVGLGSWAILAAFAPRVGLLAFPWVWGVANGRWILKFLGDWRWHHVRYAAPFVGILLAAGVIGWARIGDRLLKIRHGANWLGVVWIVAALGMLPSNLEIHARLSRVEWPIGRDEARDLWRWIDQVGPEDAVLASYEACAPLSSRASLYSDRMEQNRPKGYPQLAPEFRWVFLRKGDLDPNLLTSQGFEVVYRGNSHWVYRRPAAPVTR